MSSCGSVRGVLILNLVGHVGVSDRRRWRTGRLSGKSRGSVLLFPYYFRTNTGLTACH